MTDSARPARNRGSEGSAPLASIGVVLAIAGFALLAVEVIRTLTGGVLGTFGTVLLWVGVGVLAVGLLLLVLSLASGDDVVDDDASQSWAEPADTETVIETPQPAAPVVPPPPPAPVEAMPPVSAPAPAAPAPAAPEPAAPEAAPVEPAAAEAAAEPPPASTD